MTVSYDWLKLDEAEQISFVMYGSYEEQMQFLTDEQLGRLIRNAMHYVRTGEQKSWRRSQCKGKRRKESRRQKKS